MKALIVGSDFRWYNESYLNAFNKCFEEVKLVESSFKIDSKNIIIRLKRFFGMSIKKYENVQQEKRDSMIIQIFDSFKPDFVFIRTGNQVSERALSYIKGKAVIFLFMTDSFSRYPFLEKTIKFYDKVYSFEKSDLDIIDKYNIPCGEMYGTYDEKQYFDMQIERDIDVFFVGKMYPERLKILKQLTYDFPKLNMKFYGQYIPKHKFFSYLLFILGRDKKYFTNKDIRYDEVNRYYNRSKISLNIHHSQTKNGWNSRFCEILATGSFEIVDRNPLIEENFGDCVGLFDSYAELKDQISFYLHNEDTRKSKAKEAQNRVLHRLTILSDVQRMKEDFLTIKGEQNE